MKASEVNGQDSNTKNFPTISLDNTYHVDIVNYLPYILLMILHILIVRRFLCLKKLFRKENNEINKYIPITH